MNKSHPVFSVRDMMAFTQAARDSSFTLAGERLGMTPSAVSKAIGRLETDLGATLLRRSPRSVTLTSEGSRFLEEADRLLAAMERARAVVTDRTAMPRRTLRVSLPIHFGRMEIGPSLPRFLERYPTIDLEYLLVRNGQVDLVQSGVDVGLLMGGVARTDSRLISRKLGAFEVVICASPAYIAQFGRPERLGDLDFHRTLGGFDEETREVLPWQFKPGVQPVMHRPSFNIVSNSIEMLLDLAIAGAGIVNLPLYLAADAIKQGRLQILLPQHALAPVPAEVIYPRSRATDPEVIDFVGLLVGAMEHRLARRG